MESELRECPFCGAEARMAENHHQVTAIYCSSCGIATGPRISRADALAAWNRRAGAAETDALRAALRDVLDMFQVPISVMGGEAYNIDSETLRRARAALAGAIPAAEDRYAAGQADAELGAAIRRIVDSGYGVYLDQIDRYECIAQNGPISGSGPRVNDAVEDLERKLEADATARGENYPNREWADRLPAAGKPLYPVDKVTRKPRIPVVGTGHCSRAKCDDCGTLIFYKGDGNWGILGPEHCLPGEVLPNAS